uniref:Uncharacterized protein n=1 Tax=Arundo donax TaxID=35708 RepID=A0A0A9EHK0_ARUDO
MPWDHVGRGI